MMIEWENGDFTTLAVERSGAVVERPCLEETGHRLRVGVMYILSSGLIATAEQASENSQV